MKQRTRILIGLASLALLLLAACQTTKQVKTSPALVAPATSSIATESPGFSPKAEAGHNSIDFSLTLGNPEKVKAWKVEMNSGSGNQKTLSGNGSSIPKDLSWDGKDDSGNFAPEGSYTASLDVEYVDTYSSSNTTSSSFILDNTPPTGRLVVSPTSLVPAGNGFATPVAITIDASSKVAKIDSWSLDILDPNGKVFQSYSDKWPNKAASWDGLSSGGEQATPLTMYKALAKVRDEFGNTGEISAAVSVADVPSASGSTLIEAKYDGFAPTGESPIKTMNFLVSIGQKEALMAWKVAITGESGVQKTYSGDASNLPTSIIWDGKTDNGSPAPEGRYTASLLVGYGMAFKPVTVRSRPFVLDITPPSGRVVSDPPSLTPDGKGGLSPMIFTVIANSNLAPLDSWNLSLFGLDGKTLLSAIGQYPKNSYLWDGKLAGGAMLDPSRSYKLAAKVTSTVSVTPRTRGFSPSGASAMSSMELALSYGQPQAVMSWRVDILEADQVVKSYMGDSSTLPPFVSWDGKKQDGTLSDEGSYTATLAVDYGTMFKAATVKSAPFVLDLSAPMGQLTLSQPLFSPIESNPTLTITVDARSKVAKMESWSLKIYDPAGNLFKGFEGTWPNNKAVWDGKSISGLMVESAENYTVTATVRDEFGNSADLNSIIPIDILVEKTPTGYRILSSRIFFKAFTADYTDVPANLASQNVQRLEQLAAKLKKFPDYKIKLVGHAVMINWNNKAKGEVEQKNILIPLSKARAAAIRQAMIDRGFDPAMITSEGVGASDQLVPDRNLTDRWRNRRVAFFLEKP
jgi:flagellar hook assembly protein FlgD